MRTTCSILTAAFVGISISATANAQDQLEPPPPPPPGATEPANGEAETPNTPAPPVETTTAAPPIETPPIIPQAPIAPTDPLASNGRSIWGPGANRPTTIETRSYGAHMAYALMPGDFLMLLGFAMGDSGEGVGLRMAGYSVSMLAAPIVHWSHGHAARGFGSFAMNTAFTLPTALVGTAAGEIGFPLIFGMGAIAGQAIDVMVLSNDEVRVALEPATGLAAHKPSSVALLPMFEPQRKGVWLVGQF